VERVNRSVAKLKEKARTHEQQEEWGDAIRAYQEVLRITEEGEGDVELSLFNRIGDLYLRDGNETDALRYYELAADQYEAAGLYNSAIALCNKVIRQAPGRAEPYYKLGRLTLAQGFLSEARRWSVEYAERMLRAGKRSEAFAALNEFASHAADPEIRELLAQYLLAHDETAEALAQLLKAYQTRLQGGQTEQAGELRDRILSIDPEADLSAIEQKISGIDVAVEAGPGAESDGFGSETTDDLPGVVGQPGQIGSAGGAPSESQTNANSAALPELLLQSAADSAGIEAAVPAELVAGSIEVDLTLMTAPVADPDTEFAQELPILGEAEIEEDPLHLPEVGGLVDLELAGANPGGVDADLPTIGFGGVDLADAELDDSTLVDAQLDAAEPIGSAALPTLPSLEERADATANGIEPAASGAAPAYIDFGALLQEDDPTEVGLTRYQVEAPTPTGDEDRDFLDMLTQFKSKVSEHLGEEDAESRYDLGLAFKEMGLYDEAISQFQIALRGVEDRLKIYEELGDCFILKGDYSIALKVLKGALRLSPESGAELIGVHYLLGRSHEELGSNGEARDAYERVIAFDLEFRDASERLSRL
jgi:tetratricopeptide (TPR) repeat protein